MDFSLHRSSRREVFRKKGVLQNFAKFTGKQLCRSLHFLKKACNFVKNEIPKQMFSCKFCETSTNMYFYRTSLVAACYYIRLKSVMSLRDPDDYTTLSKLQNDSFWCQGLFKCFNGLKYRM